MFSIDDRAGNVVTTVALYRRKLVESQTAERNRLLKLLETANVKLASVATDVFGVSSGVKRKSQRHIRQGGDQR